jgi:hypothetical protein
MGERGDVRLIIFRNCGGADGGTGEPGFNY